VWSGVVIGFTVFLWTDHLRFPFLLDLMEGTILQHVGRAAHGLAVYSWPTPDFVPLAYNPLYYYLCAPVTWVFGLDLPALRLVAVAGMAGSGAIIYLTVRKWTGSWWWGLMALGLFAAAYRVMDAYLDTAHSDSWLLCAALLGTYLASFCSSWASGSSSTARCSRWGAPRS
jgi:4-amino-4-deoxy-L-arabinose transferase-like glycosyltransferase